MSRGPRVENIGDPHHDRVAVPLRLPQHQMDRRRAYGRGRVLQRRRMRHPRTHVVETKHSLTVQALIRRWHTHAGELFVEIHQLVERGHRIVPVPRPLVEPPVRTEGQEDALASVPGPGQPLPCLGYLVIYGPSGESQGKMCKPEVVLLEAQAAASLAHKRQVVYVPGLSAQQLAHPGAQVFWEFVVQPVVCEGHALHEVLCIQVGAGVRIGGRHLQPHDQPVELLLLRKQHL